MYVNTPPFRRRRAPRAYSRTSRLGARTTSTRRSALVALAIAAVTVAGCSANEKVVAAPTPPSSPSDAPPEIRPIASTRNVTTWSVNSGAVIDRSAPVPADEAAVAALAEQVGVWLDAHLDDLQNGGEGRLGDVAAAGLISTGDEAAVVGVTAGLTSPDDPVRAASYELEVGHDGAPRWLRARIQVQRASGDTAGATLVFVPTEQGPVLIALQPHGGAA